MEICKHVKPEYKEVELGHFCACHLYNTDEENVNYLAQVRAEDAQAISNSDK
jgi:hypothetical protein